MWDRAPSRSSATYPLWRLALGVRFTLKQPSTKANRVERSYGSVLAGGKTQEVDEVRVAVSASESRSAAVLSIFGMAILAVVLLFIQTTFEPVVKPAWRLDAWMTFMLAVSGSWAAAMVGFFMRRPDDAEMSRIWNPIGRWLQTALNVGFAVSPWVLLPDADPALRSLMTVLLVWFIATEVMTSSQATAVPVWEVVMLVGSTSGFIIWTGAPYAAVQAFFLAMIGLTMLGLRSLVRRTAVRAVEAKVLTERAAAITRAERDAKTRFIAAASHDLQQPIQAASLFFEHVLAADDAPSRARSIEGARAAFASTQALIGQMLDHLRLEAGAATARAEAVALGPLIAEVAAEHEPAARGAGMRLIARPSRGAVVADPVLLRRALGNLVANAVRHAGGERILVGARREGGRVTIWVIDDGRGIGAADAATLFDDYTQGAVARGPGRAGFGLGLASVRRSLELMGGTARYEPRWTSGAAFALTLPAAAERLAQAA
jgi:signal transduction histidine kinase